MFYILLYYFQESSSLNVLSQWDYRIHHIYLKFVLLDMNSNFMSPFTLGSLPLTMRAY